MNTFYDIVPIGRILNRLSKDQDKVNSSLYRALDSVIGITILFCSFLLLCAIVVPWAVLTVPVIFFLLYKT
jgi:ABC-type siderophore export system fused ATPase/permease subunit